MEECRRFLMLEQPAAFNEAIGRFSHEIFTH